MSLKLSKKNEAVKLVLKIETILEDIEFYADYEQDENGTEIYTFFHPLNPSEIECSPFSEWQKFGGCGFETPILWGECKATLEYFKGDWTLRRYPTSRLFNQGICAYLNEVIA